MQLSIGEEEEATIQMKNMMVCVATGICLSGLLLCGCSADVEVDNSKSAGKSKSAEKTKGDAKSHEPTTDEPLEAKRDKEEADYSKANAAAPTITGMSREEGKRLSVQNQIKEIFALAKKSAEEDFNINFGGFFVGMARADAVVLAEHYNLKDDEVSIVALPRKAVSQIWFSLKGVRRITKGGSTLEELAQAVANCVGDLKGYNGVWSHKTIDGVVVTFSGAGLTIRNDGVAQQTPIATVMAMQNEEADRKEVVLGIISDMIAISDGVVIKVKDEHEDEVEHEVYMAYMNKRDDKMLKEHLTEDQLAEAGFPYYTYEDWKKKYRKDKGLPEDGLKRIKGKKFKMGKYEVTQKQWITVMGYNPSKFKGRDNPVDSVSDEDVRNFLAKLNAMPEVKAWGLTFRIPAKEEWEFACRAGGKGEYCRLADGSEIRKDTLDKVAWYVGNSGKESHPVGRKKPNAFGLYDMHGNVEEYCIDFSRYGFDWVCLGGSWCDSYSMEHDYDYKYSDDKGRARVGFRLVADQENAVVQDIIRDMVTIPGNGRNVAGFKIGKYEVTQKQWVAVMGKNPSQVRGDDKPVEHVSWNDCQIFLIRLNAMPEVQTSGLKFRLPSEAEWEYACRAGGTGEYCRLADGTEITENTLGKVAWYDKTSNGTTHPVGKKMPNAFGLYDMHGNVWEWCEELCYLHRDDAIDRMRRGGSYDNCARDCAAGDRYCFAPDFRWTSLGFRLVATQVNR